MSFAPTSPVTGATVTGLTTPTYTLSSDSPPDVNAKQYAVTALGGTQTGVDVHSVSKPFTLAMFKPKKMNALPQANSTTGIIKDVPNNVYKIIGRKGAVPAANQVPRTAIINMSISIPAGTDTYEAEEIRAQWSAFVGMLNQNSSALCDVFLTGIL